MGDSFDITQNHTPSGYPESYENLQKAQQIPKTKNFNMPACVDFIYQSGEKNV